MEFIENDIGSINVFLLLYNSEASYMTADRVRQLKLYENVFGQNWWSHVISQMGHWAHDKKTAWIRSRKNMTEEIVHRIMNEKYKSLLGVSVAEIPTVFVDPILPVFVPEEDFGEYADDYTIADEERDLYINNTQILWNYATSMAEFSCTGNCQPPSGYLTGDPMILNNLVSAFEEETVGVQCQIFIGLHRENADNMQWTHNGEVIYTRTAGAVGQEQIDNLPITVTNQLLPGSEDIFFSYLSVEITEATVGEYKCENGKETINNLVNIEMRTGKAGL